MFWQKLTRPNGTDLRRTPHLSTGQAGVWAKATARAPRAGWYPPNLPTLRSPTWLQSETRIKHKDFRKEQDYMDSRSLDSCRTQLRVCLEMLETFKDNQRKKYLGRGEEDKGPGPALQWLWTVTWQSVTLQCTVSPGRPGRRQERDWISRVSVTSSCTSSECYEDGKSWRMRRGRKRGRGKGEERAGEDRTRTRMKSMRRGLRQGSARWKL